MNIFYKLTGSFAIVALICALVGGIGWLGINSTEKSLIEVAEERLPAAESLGLMMEMMNAIKSAERTIVISNITTEDRQHEMDNLVRRWEEYESGVTRFEALPKTSAEQALLNQFNRAEKQWKDEHHNLVNQATKVKLNDVERLEGVLVARQLDHVKWVASLEKSIVANTPFTGQLDPQLCAFGQWMATFTSSDNHFNQIIEKFAVPHTHLHELGNDINALLTSNQNSAAQQLFDGRVTSTLMAVETVFEEALVDVRENIGFLDQALTIAFGAERQAFNATMDSVDAMVALNSRISHDLTHTSEAAAARSKAIALFSVLIGGLAALGFGIIISRSISKPMEHAVGMLHELEQGHLTERLNMQRKDEVGQMANALDRFADSLQREVVDVLQQLAQGNLNFEVIPRDDNDVLRSSLQKMGTDLNFILGQVNIAADQIASGSTEVSDSSQSLSQGATEQASSLEQITSSMQEMASQTRLNAENATQASTLSSEARTGAKQGNTHMQQMVNAMDEINASSQSISKIIKVIDEIAFQTNLLALNAAVEAARAGQHGKGFAVVAEEVRNLAARSAKAAQETSELIESSVSKTENGSQIAHQTAAALSGIVTDISKATDLVVEIATASTEQAQGIEQVNQGLGQIDHVTQQNTASAEESAAAAEQLSSQADQLRQMMARFQLNGTASIIQQPSQPSTEALHSESGWGHMVDVITPKVEDKINLDAVEFGKY